MKQICDGNAECLVLQQDRLFLINRRFSLFLLLLPTPANIYYDLSQWVTSILSEMSLMRPPSMLEGSRGISCWGPRVPLCCQECKRSNCEWRAKAEQANPVMVQQACNEVRLVNSHDGNEFSGAGRLGHGCNIVFTNMAAICCIYSERFQLWKKVKRKMQTESWWLRCHLDGSGLLSVQKRLHRTKLLRPPRFNDVNKLISLDY